MPIVKEYELKSGRTITLEYATKEELLTMVRAIPSIPSRMWKHLTRKRNKTERCTKCNGMLSYDGMLVQLEFFRGVDYTSLCATCEQER